MHDMTTAADMPDATLVKRVLLFVLLPIAATAGVISLAMGLGELFVSTAILGGLFATAVLFNPTIGIIALLGTILLGLPPFLAGAGRLTANNLLGLILIGMLAIQLCMTRDFWFVRTPQSILVILICAAFVVSLVRSWYLYIPAGPLGRNFTENTLFLLFSRLAFLMMLANFLKTPRHVILVLLSLLAFTMVVLPSVVYNLVTQGDEVEAMARQAGDFRVTSDISSWGKNANRLAFMCNISILLLWTFAQIWKAKIFRLLAMLTMLILAALVLTTVSRSGFLSLGMIFLFLLFQKGISRGFRLGIIAAVVFCVLVFFLVLPPRASERLLNLTPDQSERTEGWRSTQIRIESKEHAIEVFKNDPLFGVGPGNFRWLHQQLYPYSIAAGRPPHDSYLWAATEGGIVAVVLYLLLFLFIARDLRAARQKFSTSHQLWHVTRFLGGYLMIFLFFSAFADFWLEPHLYLLAGLSMLMKRFATEGEGAHPAPLLAGVGG
jgi:O-antigen ligase